MTFGPGSALLPGPHSTTMRILGRDNDKHVVLLDDGGIRHMSDQELEKLTAPEPAGRPKAEKPVAKKGKGGKK